MKKNIINKNGRVIFLARYYLALIACFIPLRLLFMFLNGKEPYTLIDYLQTVWHGLPLDIAVAGYFTAIPLLITIVGLFAKINPRKALFPYSLLVAAIISIAFIADISLYPFWEFKLDASFLIYIDSPTNAIASVSTEYLLLRILLFIILSSIILIPLHIATPKKFADTTKKLLNGLSLLLFGGILFLGIRGGVTESTNNVGTVYFSDRQFINHSAVNPIFSFLYSLGKNEDYSSSYNFFDEKELHEYFNGLYEQDQNISDTLLANNRPNIITIIFEGLNWAVVEELGGKKGITPNFERLSQEGIFFTNCYANSYRTDRGLICALSGYPSFPKTSVMKSPIKSQTLPSIAGSLSKAGYHNTFLYGGDINFTNMNGYMLSSGYNKTISNHNFTKKQQETHKWGVTDHITFDSLLYLAENVSHTPWHITYLTLSSHEPWVVPFHRIENDKVANSFAYTDSCFGNFIDRLKKSEVWDNTLVLCFADHTATGYPKGIKQTNIERNRIPLLLLGGAIKEPHRISTICNQTDIPATILAQLGLPIDEFKFSRNILSPVYRYPFAYHSYNNGISLIDSTGFSVYDLDANTPLFEQPNDNTHRRINVAKAILQKSYQDYLQLGGNKHENNQP